MAFSPSGDAILTACDDHITRLWKLGTIHEDNPEQLRLLVEVQTGFTNADGEPRRLNQAEWLLRQQMLWDRGK
ncbi:MAG: WD40 repeat domain-containing protein [Planctomycetota bacterium]|nr:WD40 repeat domain-containing protein [Planctomycetota bacterium]